MAAAIADLRPTAAESRSDRDLAEPTCPSSARSPAPGPSGAPAAPMAIHRDRRTGEVRAILRGERALGGAPAGTEVLRSRGIPGPEAWRR